MFAFDTCVRFGYFGNIAQKFIGWRCANTPPCGDLKRTGHAMSITNSNFLEQLEHKQAVLDVRSQNIERRLDDVEVYYRTVACAAVVLYGHISGMATASEHLDFAMETVRLFVDDFGVEGL